MKNNADSLGQSPGDALALLRGEASKIADKANVDSADAEPRPAEYRHHLTLGVVTHAGDAVKLKRLLEGCSKHFGTVVVVDTTPGEPSQEVADAVLEVVGASVHHFPWCEDFAAARNEVLRFCPAKGWLFMLDSDEQLAVQSPKVLRWLAVRADRDHQVEGRNPPDAWQLCLLNESERGNTMLKLTRVFRLGHPSLRYTSRMHEYVVGTRDQSMHLAGALPAIILGHDGYNLDAPGIAAKSVRNERLADLQLEDAPEDPHSWYLVGITSNDPERAHVYLRRLAEWAHAHPLQAKLQGWIREGLVRACIRQAELARLLGSTGSPALDQPSKMAWRKAEIMCAAARVLMPGLPHTVADLGEADLRFLHARCKFMLRDVAGAYDALMPTMAQKSVAWLSPDAAYVERMWLWVRILVDLHEYAQALMILDKTLEQADKHLTSMAKAYHERLDPLREYLLREQEAWKGQMLDHIKPDERRRFEMSDAAKENEHAGI